ncbi:hypothetical protein [Actinocorallia populi]|uniref:hypothetical protein n=1 Tax=Actinocorallia populi TaxID=2079200 RepID=UPI001E305B24|nr:hypothetical protein [Actinocorallia populi]
MPVPVSRRAVLGGAAGLVCLAGCAEPAPRDLTPGPEVAVLLGAIADEERLISLYEQVTTAYSGLSSAFTDALRDHREHLAVLRRHYVPGTGGATATPAVSGTAFTPPSSAAEAVPAVRAAEKAAAAARIADMAAAPAGLAQLLASIGACEAGHATALGMA